MDHAFTVIWIGAKLPERRPIMQPGEEAFCICAICGASWNDHGEPNESQWEWRNEWDALLVRDGQEVKSPPFGIVDGTYPLRLKAADYPCEIVLLAACMVYRDQDSGLVSQSDADFAKKYGYGVSTVRRARTKLIEKRLLFPEGRHSNLSGSANSYLMPPAVNFNASRAERRAKASARRPARNATNQSSSVSVARPSQDHVTADLPAEERAANLKRLAAMTKSGSTANHA
jgi:hypothetical protein